MPQILDWLDFLLLGVAVTLYQLSRHLLTRPSLRVLFDGVFDQKTLEVAVSSRSVGRIRRALFGRHEPIQDLLMVGDVWCVDGSSDIDQECPVRLIDNNSGRPVRAARVSRTQTVRARLGFSEEGKAFLYERIGRDGGIALPPGTYACALSFHWYDDDRELPPCHFTVTVDGLFRWAADGFVYP